MERKKEESKEEGQGGERVGKRERISSWVEFFTILEKVIFPEGILSLILLEDVPDA